MARAHVFDNVMLAVCGVQLLQWERRSCLWASMHRWGLSLLQLVCIAHS